MEHLPRGISDGPVFRLRAPYLPAFPSRLSGSVAQSGFRSLHGCGAAGGFHPSSTYPSVCDLVDQDRSIQVRYRRVPLMCQGENVTVTRQNVPIRGHRVSDGPHFDGADGALPCAQAASHAFLAVKENLPRHSPLGQRASHVKCAESTQIDTQHTERTQSLVDARSRPLRQRYRLHSGTTIVNDAAEWTGHTTDRTIDTPKLIDYMHLSCLARNGYNGADIFTLTASRTVVKNRMCHPSPSPSLSRNFI